MVDTKYDLCLDMTALIKSEIEEMNEASHNNEPHILTMLTELKQELNLNNKSVIKSEIEEVEEAQSTKYSEVEEAHNLAMVAGLKEDFSFEIKTVIKKETEERVNARLLSPPSEGNTNNGRLHKINEQKKEVKQKKGTHMKTAKQLKCQICQKTFSSNSYLKTHERLHNGDNPFKCQLCQKELSSPSSLKNHQFVHTGRDALAPYVKHSRANFDSFNRKLYLEPIMIHTTVCSHSASQLLTLPPILTEDKQS
ncbi:zinc finger protein 519 [Biomphalaria glabrata]|nr:zinc finger protein 519 [Biomphalaria glabrata]